MSTLPFLLSVADELDNIHSQSYMDDFGLGFHPHRQYYRTPSIQLSLPASTDWMQERQRCRTHKFIDESQNNLQEEEDLAEDEDATTTVNVIEDSAAADAGDYGADKYGASTSGGGRQKQLQQHKNSNSNNGEENIDNSVQMYKLSKKCCKNYHRQAAANKTATQATAATSEKTSATGRLHAKCLEPNNSSSEESLQKVPSSSIEFLTCFLMKKSRAPKQSGSESSGKKS